MAPKTELSPRSIAQLMVHVFGPSIWDAPPWNGGGPWYSRRDATYGPQPHPWDQFMLKPQPFPSGERLALQLADAYIFHLLELQGAALGDPAGSRRIERALKVVAEIDELCPQWPKGPRVWPPPPPSPPWQREEMTSVELFVFGTRLLAASEVFEDGKLQQALANVGEKAMGLAVKSM